MTRNNVGGKKFKKHKKQSTPENQKLEIVDKSKGEQYGRVLKKYGDNRLLVKCTDNKERLCIVPGALRKKIRFAVDDFVIVGIRNFQTDSLTSKADILHKYEDNDIKLLIKKGELDQSLFIDMNVNTVEDDIQFDDNDEHEKEITEKSQKDWWNIASSDDELNNDFKQKLDSL